MPASASSTGQMVAARLPLKAQAIFCGARGVAEQFAANLRFLLDRYGPDKSQLCQRWTLVVRQAMAELADQRTKAGHDSELDAMAARSRALHSIAKSEFYKIFIDKYAVRY